MPTDEDHVSVRPMALLLAIVVIGIVAVIGSVFLGGQTSTILSTVGSPVHDPAGDTTEAAPVPVAETANGSAIGFTAIVDVARADLLVIRTGTIELQVQDVRRAVDDATTAIETIGGYVAASEQTGDGSGLKAVVTYRIPVRAWDPAVADLRTLATKVVSAETHTEDVTAQVVDLTARIVNLRATEQALQGIMATATEVSDVLDVQAELTTVRGQIEEAVAQKQQFEDQAAFSTLTAHFALKPVAAVVATQNQFDPQSEADRATARLVRVVQRAVTAGIWFGIVWLPILLVLGLVLGTVLVIGIRARRGVWRPTPTGPG